MLPVIRPKSLPAVAPLPTDDQLDKRNTSISSGLNALLPIQLVGATVIGSSIAAGAAPLPVVLSIATLGWSALFTLLAMRYSPHRWEDTGGDEDKFMRRQAGLVIAKESMRRQALYAVLPAMVLIAWCAATGFAG